MDTNTNTNKLPSSQFKGVVPQPNGRWGAQIYEKHQRVWLGTFNEESEAAKAYDVAAQRFRGLDGATNFNPLDRADATEAVELRFLNSQSKAEVVDMLRKHSYEAELEDFRKKGEEEWHGTSSLSSSVAMISSIFEKTVTPSDVGKLNRLVIPKQHAERHFPLEAGESSKGRLLNLEDEEGKVWRFRYSYWNSSQSYVITKGWSHFVKEKRLKAGDVVSFHRSVGPDKKLFITWKQSNAGGGDDDGASSSNAGPVRPVEMVRLFGVNIAKNNGDD